MSNLGTLVATLTDSEHILAAVAGGGGWLLGLVTQRLASRRSLFTYFVLHQKIGFSTDDAIFGSVRVTWNDNQVAQLYTSTVELRNESLHDFEDVNIMIYTSDTILLTERTELVGTPDIVRWSQEFAARMHVAPGESPTNQQREAHGRSREYRLPTFNRGAVAKFQYLNAGKTAEQPTVWLHINHKGVRLRFHKPGTFIWGVPQTSAVLAGLVLSLICLLSIISFIESVAIAATVAMLFGLFAQAPGAAVLKGGAIVKKWLRG